MGRVVGLSWRIIAFAVALVVSMWSSTTTPSAHASVTRYDGSIIARVDVHDLSLLAEPETVYRTSGTKYRRILNQAVFEKVYIYENEDSDQVLKVPFAELYEAQERLSRHRRSWSAT